jgi:hypothetical protein
LTALLPAALVLAWSAVAATAFTALVAAPLLGQPVAALALAPRRPATAHALLLALLVYPPCYALGFAILGEANLFTGLLLAALHALVLAALSFRAGGAELIRDNAARLGLCLLYGAVLGFTFLLP